MILTKEITLLLANIAIDAAMKAGSMIKSYANRDIKVNYKETGDSLSSQVVTEVDLLSQEIILKHITPTCKIYDLGLLAEESNDDLSRFEKDYFWCIDPLDGTLPFTQKRDGYAISIALVSKEGIPFIGVVYDPRTETLYHAIKDGGAFRNHKVWDLKTDHNKTPTTIDSGGAVMNVCWILENKSSYYYKNKKNQEGGGCVWDYAATACLCLELGAHVSDVYGNDLDLNRKESPFMNHKGVLFAASKNIAKQFIKKY